MNNSDKTLFEQHFHYVGSKRIGYRQLRYFINFILNSKEFNDSGVKISNLRTKGILLNSTFIAHDVSCFRVSFESEYVITDGINKECRNIEGNITVGNGEVSMLSEVTRYGSKTETFKLSEEFYIENNSYVRLSLYPDNSYKESISCDSFEKYDDFEEKTLKMLRGK